MIFTHSVVAQNESVTAGTVVSYDLPVSPLSMVFLTLRFLQNQANTQLTFANIPAMISKVEVLYKGQAVISLSGLDLIALNAFILGFEPWVVNDGGDDNDVRAFTWVIPFGRKPYSISEAFPATKRGELVLQITYATSFTQIDTVTCQVESVELPEASPDRFVKATTLVGTPAATGQFDIELPIGNMISDLIVYGTTIPSGATATKTINDVQIRKNNAEIYFSKANFETILAMAGLFSKCPDRMGSHIHQLDAAAYAQYMDTLPVKSKQCVVPNHIRIPFDVLHDGTYGLVTEDATSLCVRFTVGDTNAIRVIPIEIVKVGA